jgi:hypothetical protein
MGLLQGKHYNRDIWLALKDIYFVSPLPGLTIYISVLVLASLYLLQVYCRRQRATRIRGPQSPGWVFGFAKIVLDSTVTTELYERWAREYGPVYKVPGILGQSKVILWDPKAISHFFARDTWLYNQTQFNKSVVRTTVCHFTILYSYGVRARLCDRQIGRGVLWADGESHKRLEAKLPSFVELNPYHLFSFIRQRKALNPAFSAAAIRSLTSVFYDAAHKVSRSSIHPVLHSKCGTDSARLGQ